MEDNMRQRQESEAIPERPEMMMGSLRTAMRLAARGEPESWIVVTTGNHVDIKYNYLG
jgi:hypothetical protein